MNKPERYILGVKEMKHLKELGLDIESDNDSVVYWVKFIQTRGVRKCHRWKKSIRGAQELNRRNPQFGHYIGMPAYTLQQVIEQLGRYHISLLDCSTLARPEAILMSAYNVLCETITSYKTYEDK